jgi:adenosylcobinamide-GDP ribazoletransferase
MKGLATMSEDHNQKPDERADDNNKRSDIPYIRQIIDRLPNLRLNTRLRLNARFDARSIRQATENLPALAVTEYRELVAAIRFLSVVPIPGSARLFSDPLIVGEAQFGSGYFPLIGLLIALLLSLLVFVAGAYLPSLILAALLVVAETALTGGLHLEGLMDTCDGFFSGKGTERKLEIMRDSRVGSFGVLGCFCLLLLKFAFFASLGLNRLPIALLLALPMSRWSMVAVAYLFPSARLAGLGAAFRQTITTPRLLLATAIVLVIILIAGHFAGLGIWLGATLIAIAVGAWATRVLGGLTGDLYGAIAEVTTVVSLLLFTLLQRFI